MDLNLAELMTHCYFQADGAYALQKMREEFRAHENDAHEEVLELKAMARKIRPEIEAQSRWALVSTWRGRSSVMS